MALSYKGRHRTRSEIEEEAADSSNEEELTLEVLLDIRDYLAHLVVGKDKD